jgi:hypothetical protein
MSSPLDIQRFSSERVRDFAINTGKYLDIGAGVRAGIHAGGCLPG